MDRSLLARMKNTSCALLLSSVGLSCFAPEALAYSDEEEDMIGYDVIVNELTSQQQSQTASSRARLQQVTPADPFANVWMHLGAGYASTMQTVSLPGSGKSHLSHRGFQASLGIDLFSENWMAEGTARSFGDEESQATNVSLREFELKVFYKNRVSQTLGFRAGGGLAARYMTIKDGDSNLADYSTPSSVATLGLDMFLSKSFSFGLDVSARNTMIAETIDKNSYDATIRMDSHF